jgi:hypothetical protein
MKTSHVLLMGIAAGVGMPAATAGAQEMSKDIIAVQIRKQGFECKNPESATRDPAASKPDDAAWILRCEGITYKVQLVPNQAAKVERVPDDQKTTQQP